MKLILSLVDNYQNKQQAEAEVVPSSSLVELEVEVGVKVGLEVGLRLGLGLGSRCSSVFLLFRSGGREEKWRLKLTSA